MSSETVVKLADFGSMLGTRILGMRIRTEIERKIDAGEGPVVLDAAGVSTMSHSFADECFGKLAERRGLDAFIGAVRFRNVPPDLNSVLRYVIGSRSRRAHG
ncbi:STAS-like domain-containing protein [Sorangium sp. So ce1036]|uniref:STAS-like domain-containing protein n=1 Tax=Sorangium sp. So ce1036 TaxID=3133328 RepID=UPI003EFC433D